VWVTVAEVVNNLQMPDDRALDDPDVPAIVFENVSLAFDDNVVLDDVSFSVHTGATLFLLGASGSGKSVVLKLILGLLKPDAGVIRVRGDRIDNMSEQELLGVRGDIGMLFQETALFDSLTVADNVGYRLIEEMAMPLDDAIRRSREVLGFVGLADYMDRMPSELSGGQRRRVAIARAFASKPRHLLIDDPTSGLDPITSKTIDNEIVKLRDLEHVTSIVVTHQIPDAHYIASHEAVQQNGRVAIVAADPQKAEEAEFIMLADAKVYFDGTFAALRGSTDPYVKKFLS
jgi:phospholipid/cholesterol/gamma-HCH transport system ATP-binding protein